jgi:anaerobic selenocysteine-containing dehydrogenase
MPYARCSFDELARDGYRETGHVLPAPWVDDHVARFGGWRLAPPALVDQLASVAKGQLAARRRPESLLLIPRRQRRHVNAQFLFLGDRPEVILHPADAQAAGVEDGQAVLVASDRGEIRCVAKVDAKIRPGVVSVPHGHEDANVNCLTSAAVVDSLTGMARYSGLPVSVRPA